MTVLGIRGYLYLTGYPQISTGELHIAHMLWGGIALFVGSTLMLLYRSLYLSRIAAVLTGVGWGLFIDEIGKFLTKTNDYFFAPAAVIIYGIFLVVAGIYVYFFRPRKKEPKPSDNEAFSDIRELLDGVAAGELTSRERQLLQLRIDRLLRDDEVKFRDLGKAIKNFVDQQPLTIKQQRIEIVTSFFGSLVSRVVTSSIFIYVLVGLIVCDVTISIITVFGVGPFQGIFYEIGTSPTDELVRFVSIVLRLILQGLIVYGLVIASRHRIVTGRRLMVGLLLFIIIVLDSIDFYFGQFSTAYTVALDVFLLAMIEGRFGSDRGKLQNASDQ